MTKTIRFYRLRDLTDLVRQVHNYLDQSVGYVGYVDVWVDITHLPVSFDYTVDREVDKTEIPAGMSRLCRISRGQRYVPMYKVYKTLKSYCDDRLGVNKIPWTNLEPDTIHWDDV